VSGYEYTRTDPAAPLPVLAPTLQRLTDKATSLIALGVTTATFVVMISLVQCSARICGCCHSFTERKEDKTPVTPIQRAPLSTATEGDSSFLNVQSALAPIDSALSDHLPKVYGETTFGLSPKTMYAETSLQVDAEGGSEPHRFPSQSEL